jgi:flagellar basal-body rod protein FlgB
MSLNIDKALGVHQNALLLFERRTQLLAENIANADTPNYKSRDIDFNKVLNGEVSKQVSLQTEQPKHIAMNQSTLDASIEYRVPDQSAADGSTVDMSQEQAAFADNTVRYQTTLTILTRRLSGIANAFRGE